jgi:hypothetical protein
MTASGVVMAHKSALPAGHLRLTFLRSSKPGIPRGSFEIDVVQTRVRDGRKTVVGGVTYELHTDRPKR